MSGVDFHRWYTHILHRHKKYARILHIDVNRLTSHFSEVEAIACGLTYQLYVRRRKVKLTIAEVSVRSQDQSASDVLLLTHMRH